MKHVSRITKTAVCFASGIIAGVSVTAAIDLLLLRSPLMNPNDFSFCLGILIFGGGLFSALPSLLTDKAVLRNFDGFCFMLYRSEPPKKTVKQVISEFVEDRLKPISLISVFLASLGFTMLVSTMIFAVETVS